MSSPQAPEPVGLTGEQQLLLVFLGELEQIITSGFAGQIVLHCPGDGTVPRYDVNQALKTGSGKVALPMRGHVT